MLRGPRNIRPRDMQTSKLLSAMRSGIVVCICSRMERGAIFSSQLRTAFSRYSGLGSLQAIGQVSLPQIVFPLYDKLVGHYQMLPNILTFPPDANEIEGKLAVPD
jgi:hypothetical protein